jgi:hypothetical protein
MPIPISNNPRQNSSMTPKLDKDFIAMEKNKFLLRNLQEL